MINDNNSCRIKMIAIIVIIVVIRFHRHTRYIRSYHTQPSIDVQISPASFIVGKEEKRVKSHTRYIADRERKMYTTRNRRETGGKLEERLHGIRLRVTDCLTSIE